ncbi:hypothetical protein MPCS_00752 [Candidatus Megaera polyxenophila]|nr:hypothetical protein MPCS_00752 [Candidatus Megaera polyxenophila]
MRFYILIICMFMVTYFMFKFLARNNLWQRKDHFGTGFSGAHAAVIIMVPKNWTAKNAK